MKSKIRVACLLLAAAALFAACDAQEDSGSGLLLSIRHSVSGTLVRLDRGHNQIVVRNRKSVDVAVEIDSATRVPAAAVEGARVSVRYNLKQGKKVASVVKVF